MNHLLRLSLLLLLPLILLACAPPTPSADSTPAARPEALILVTHDSFDISAEVLAQFKNETGIEVQILKAGDAGEMLNTLLLSPEHPLGDVVYGLDNAFLSRALEANLFAPYPSPLLADIPDALELDPGHSLLPVDFGYVSLNYDKAWFTDKGLAPPDDLEDLAQPAYRSLAVIQNPASSSPGLAFMLATIARFGESGDYTWLDYWRDLRANDVLIADGWSEAYYGAFTAGSGGEGDRPIVVSYATSPAAEVYFNNLTEPPTASIDTPGNSFEQIEFVGILANSPRQETARRLVDFLLSPAFQEDIPLHMFVYPANEKAAAGELFEQWAAIPGQPARLAPDAIASGREGWISAWTDVMLR
jgi:thiamine transport system substrate-binding protein